MARSWFGSIIVVLAALGGASAAFADRGPEAVDRWTVPGFTVETYRRAKVSPRAPSGDEALVDESLALRFIAPDGTVVADFPGDGGIEAWTLIASDIRVDGIDAPLAAFFHYAGGAHCCSRVEVFRLGAAPDRLARTPLQEGDLATIVETDEGWIVPSHDMSFAYAFGHAYATSPFPPAYWRLTARGFVSAPEMQRLDARGMPALLAHCRIRPEAGEDPACGDFMPYGEDDATLRAGIAEAVATGEGRASRVLGALPAGAFERFAQGRAEQVLDLLEGAGAPPEVGRILVQAFAARPYWREIVALNGLDVLLRPLGADGPALAPAGDALVQPLAAYGGRTLAIARVNCTAQGEARLDFVDPFGAELGAVALTACPVLSVPLYLDDEDGYPALVAARDGVDGDITALALATPGGGFTVPVDLPGLAVDGATDADRDGRAEALSLSLDGGEAQSCPVIDAPAFISCMDGLSNEK
ncbi:MAG: hypothetical protein PHS60_04935 [Zavarzinia sp.]|nr:hypothetical protein [Zavarzinia sp.]